jgi:hypothetical protein
MPQVTQPTVWRQFVSAATMPFDVEEVRPEEISGGTA